MLRELKVFLDQLERDVLRAQGAEGNLTDKYQVIQTWRDKLHCYKAGVFQPGHYHCFIILFCRHSKASVYNMK